MKDKILLSKVVDALYHISDRNEIYFNFNTTQIISLDVDMTSEEREQILNLIEENEGAYLHLPNQFELDGYNRMRRFIKTLGETKYIKEFENAIKGKGAFRRFKDLLIAYGIRDYWHEFERDEFVKIAENLLIKNNIEFENDIEDDFDLKCEKEIEKNEQYLKMFKEHLLEEGSAERTIEKYVDDMDTYLNGYLLFREIITAIEGVNLASSFFNSWYPRFLIPNNDQTNSFKTSLKRFYKWFLAKKLVTEEEYDNLLQTLKAD